MNAHKHTHRQMQSYTSARAEAQTHTCDGNRRAMIEKKRFTRLRGAKISEIYTLDLT